MLRVNHVDDPQEILRWTRCDGLTDYSYAAKLRPRVACQAFVRAPRRALDLDWSPVTDCRNAWSTVDVANDSVIKAGAFAQFPGKGTWFVAQSSAHTTAAAYFYYADRYRAIVEFLRFMMARADAVIAGDARRPRKPISGTVRDQLPRSLFGVWLVEGPVQQ